MTSIMMTILLIYIRSTVSYKYKLVLKTLKCCSLPSFHNIKEIMLSHIKLINICCFAGDQVENIHVLRRTKKSK